MRVRLLVGRPSAGKIIESGAEHDFPQDEAIRLISVGNAVPVVEDKIERAVAQPAPEIRKGKGKGAA